MQFSKNVLQKMLQSALSAVERESAMLNQLDAATGDGDHGTAIVTAMKAAALSAQKEGGLKMTLETIGWDIMSSTSGSTSALNGSFFLGMASAVSGAVTGEELDIAQTVALFEAGLANVKTSSKATVGDKTLMDALIPAIEAMTALKDTSSELSAIFAAAADAAQKGADATKDLAAKFGRAKNLGERSRGSLDAGAVSTALIYKAYAEAVSAAPNAT